MKKEQMLFSSKQKHFLQQR